MKLEETMSEANAIAAVINRLAACGKSPEVSRRAVTVRARIQSEPGVIVEVQLAPEVLRWFREHFHVHDVRDPIEMGQAVTRMLQQEVRRRAEEKRQQG